MTEIQSTWVMIVIMILEYDNLRAARHASNTLKN